MRILVNKSIYQTNLRNGDYNGVKTLLEKIGKIFSFLLVIFISNGYVIANTWQSIIGIPEPPFGITTSHMMYADCDKYKYDFGSGPECYRIGPDGPYTHYIDPAHPNATDTNNPYGTPNKPRITRPNNISGNPAYGNPLPAGSVVEIHRGTQGGIGPTNCYGTAEAPIFIRGVEGSEPTFHSGGFHLGGSHLIFENIKFDMNQTNRTVIYIGYQDVGAQCNIAVRNCEFFNGEYVPSESYQVIRIKNSHNNAHLIENVVVYKNHFHNIGDGRTTPVKRDAVAVSIDANVKYVWIIGNTFGHIGGDGIQVAWDKFASSTEMPQYIYIGKNIAHDCYENFLDLKMCQDVIVSQNTAYNFGEGYCDNGGGSSIPYRYGSGEGSDTFKRNNIWTLFNLSYNINSPDGAFVSFNKETEMPADEIYYIGNIAYNCHNSDGDSTAFGSWNQEKIYWVNNVAYNCDRGGVFFGDRFGTLPTEKLTIINNIFGDLHKNTKRPYNLMVAGVPDSLNRSEIGNNIFYENSGSAKIRWGVYNPSIRWEDYNYAAFKIYRPDKVWGSSDNNPGHVNAANGDFRLASGSPGIDAGKTHDYFDKFQKRYGISIQVDFENKPVPKDGIDIGAYENNSDSSLDAPNNLRIIQ